jgi:HEAT repeat protein
MRAKMFLRLEALFYSLLGAGTKRSPALETFCSSLAEEGAPDFAAPKSLQGRERELAGRRLMDALPEAAAVLEAESAADDADRRRFALIAAAQALWRREPRPRYVRAIIGRLRFSPSRSERMEAAAALAHIPTPEADAALAEALDDGDALVRHHAARALLAIHGVAVDPRAVHIMVYRLMAAQAERQEAAPHASPLANDAPVRVRGA